MAKSPRKIGEYLKGYLEATKDLPDMVKKKLLTIEKHDRKVQSTASPRLLTLRHQALFLLCSPAQEAAQEAAALYPTAQDRSEPRCGYKKESQEFNIDQIGAVGVLEPVS